MSSTAEWNAASFVLDGLLKPVIFLTYCSEAAFISSSVAGGSKLKRVLMFLHIEVLRRNARGVLSVKYHVFHPCSSFSLMIRQERDGTYRLLPALLGELEGRVSTGAGPTAFRWAHASRDHGGTELPGYPALRRRVRGA